MKEDKAHILEIVQSYPFVQEAVDKGCTDSAQWTINLLISVEREEPLPFTMQINLAITPMKCGDESPIQFFNEKLMSYPHIMPDGHLCLHTPQCVVWEDRVRAEIEALHLWIEQYYVNNAREEAYEEIYVESKPILGRWYTFYYTQLSAVPAIGSYGKVNYYQLASNKYELKEAIADTYIVRDVVKSDGTTYESEWSKVYQPMHVQEGVYVMLNGSPAEYGKFAFESYDKMDGLCTAAQWRYIYQKLYKGKKRMPIFWGYTTPMGKLRWLVTIPQERFLSQNKEKGIQNKPLVRPVDMSHVDSMDISYEQFFGRGRFPDAVVEKKILILGIGAIGSGLATTLVRGGVKHIGICDFDKKIPGNVCRSEYMFKSGLIMKTEELKTILEQISPFVEVTKDDKLGFLKQHYETCRNEVEELLNAYDIIFDCTIDGELMWTLEQLDLRAQVVHLSISNKANDLICAFSPKIREFVNFISTQVISEKAGDLYNPEGCWSPTFKASYNDVQIMVQYALRYIVKMLSGEMEKRNFTVIDKDGALQLTQW